MSMTVMMDITRAVKPPRAAFLDFPPGHTTGRPFDLQQQEAIVRAALAGLETIDVSGTILELPFTWSADEAWKRSPLPERLPRYDTPQYQSEADRRAAGDHAAEVCAVCVVG